MFYVKGKAKRYRFKYSDEDPNLHLKDQKRTGRQYNMAKEASASLANTTADFIQKTNDIIDDKMEKTYDYVLDGIAYKDIVLADGQTVCIKPVGIVLAGSTIKLKGDKK